MTNPRLKVVDQAVKPTRDIYAADKALIASIDWSRVHVAGDRRSPIYLPDTRRGWAK